MCVNVLDAPGLIIELMVQMDGLDAGVGVAWAHGAFPSPTTRTKTDHEQITHVS